MHLISEIEPHPPRTQFKQSALYHAIPLAIFLGLIAGTIYWHQLGSLPLGGAIGLCAFFGLFARVMFSSLKKTMAPTNWILAIDRAQVFIKFRSYQNPHFPKTDPQIIQCAVSEIASARVTKQTLTKYGMNRERTTSRHTFLDLIPAAPNLTPLKDQLKYERTITPPTTGKFIKSRGKAHHYPVSVVNDRIIRVEWRSPTDRISPGIKNVMELLRAEKIQIDPVNKEVLDMTRTSADQSNAEDQILFLAERGDLIAATKLARKSLGLSLTEARKFVEELTQ